MDLYVSVYSDHGFVTIIAPMVSDIVKELLRAAVNPKPPITINEV